MHNTKRLLVSYQSSELRTPTEDKPDYVKDSFYEEVERVFNEISK
jgi:hypothetical protein